MNTRTFALIFGIVFLVIGAGGFIPGSTRRRVPDPGLTMTHGFGHELGLFPVNTLHNIVHLLFGVWGIVAYKSYGGARTYFRVVAVDLRPADDHGPARADADDLRLHPDLRQRRVAARFARARRRLFRLGQSRHRRRSRLNRWPPHAWGKGEAARSRAGPFPFFFPRLGQALPGRSASFNRLS